MALQHGKVQAMIDSEKQTPRIMIVEDNAFDVSILEKASDSMGGRVASIVDSGEEALALVQKDPPDLILIDVALKGGLGGIQTAERIRRDVDVPILFITASTENQVWKRARAFNPCGYLVKPLNPEVVAANLEMAWQRARMDKTVKDTRRQLDEALDDLRERRAESDALRNAVQAIFRQNDLRDSVRLIYDECKRLIGARAGYVALLSEDEQENELLFLDAGGLECNVDPAQPMPIRGLRADAYRTGQTVLDNAFHDSEWKKFLPDGHMRLDNVLFVPLMIEGRASGLIGLANKPEGFTARDVEKLEAFGNLTAMAIHNSRVRESLTSITATLEEKVKERTYQLDVLSGLSGQLGFAPDYDELFRLMMVDLEKVIEHDVTAGLVKTGPRFNLYLQSRRPMSDGLVRKIKSRLTRAFQLLGQDEVDDAAAIEVRAVREYRYDPAASPLEELRSMFQIPLISGEQKDVAGILFVGSTREHQFTEAQVRFLYGVANQVSEAIDRIKERLGWEQAQLVSIVENLPHGIALLDESNRIVMMNSSAVAPLTELAGAQYGQVLELLNGLSIRELTEAGVGVHELRHPGPPARVFEVMGRRLDAGPMSGGTILAIRDVTEESQMADRVQQQERLAAVGQLAAGIAHDFNNLLTTIGGYSEMISSDLSATPDIRERAQVVRQQVRRASSLIRQILDFSRKSLATSYDIQLVPFLKETYKLLKRTIRENVDLEFRHDPGEYVVKADPVGLQQVITNLAINAQDAMPGGGQLRINLSLESYDERAKKPLPQIKAGEWVKLTVSDTGHGIPPDQLFQVFDPFFTTKPVGKGTGLGLSQALGIIESHGGCMDLKSRVGRGTTFTMYLPARESKKAAPEAHVERKIPRGRNEFILLVEDEPLVLKMAEKMLTRIGYRVLKANNGLEALEVYRGRSQEIALVLTDMVMPKMGGKDLIPALKDLNPAVKIIVWTGYPLDGSEEFLKGDVVDWVMKPPDLDVLARKIKAAIQ